ncbi:orotate phosphoribosyltransferase [Candidatus Woesearchaeota archaeon]|nr:orotate phosphoribosyltransferase [Candidatus Woesearchaeota archaeon]
MGDKIAETLLRLNAVIIRPENPFKFVSGMLSPIYTDHRLLMSYPKEREFIVKSLIKLLKKKNLQFDAIAATATAGIPWGAWISQKLSKPMIYVRGEIKDHGRENLVEGMMEQNKRYLVVEDMVSTGKSSVNTINAVREKGGIVEDCIAIFTYEFEKSKNNFAGQNVNLHTLTNFTSLAKSAVKKGHISKEQLAKIKEWNKNPEAWAAI